MRAWRAWALAAGVAACAGIAVAQSPADGVVRQLREQGYVAFEVSSTLLGRIRVVATAPDGERREIVFNPATGEILRDYHEAAEGGDGPRILDRSEDQDASAATSSPTRGGGGDGAQGPDRGDDGNQGHGNDDDGSDDGNPGRGHGSDGAPGGGRGGGNGNSAGGGGGNGDRH